MIKVKHPDAECNQQQELFIAQLDDSQRRYHELLFCHGNASFLYHKQAQAFDPTEIDFQEWLDGLPDNVKAEFERRGFEECKRVLSFARYVNEKNDIGMDQYVKQLMGDDFDEYISLLKRDNG